MREVEVVVYCDPHLDRGEKVTATKTETVAVDGVEAEIDFCTDCHPIAQQLKRILKRLSATQAAVKGARTTKGARRDRDAREHKSGCGMCDNIRFFLSRNRTDHARSMHGKEPQDITWTFGPEVERLWLCSCTLPFTSLMGLSAHVRRTGHARAKANPVPNPAAA